MLKHLKDRLNRETDRGGMVHRCPATHTHTHTHTHAHTHTHTHTHNTTTTTTHTHTHTHKHTHTTHRQRQRRGLGRSYCPPLHDDDGMTYSLYEIMCFHVSLTLYRHATPSTLCSHDDKVQLLHVYLTHHSEAHPT